DPEVRRNVDVMVERFAEGLEKDVGNDFQDQSVAEMAGKPDDNQSFEGETEKEAVRFVDTISSASVCVESPANSQREYDDRALRTSDVPPIQDAHERLINQKGAEESNRGAKILLRSKRTNYCPPKVSRSVISGPWSLEWLNDHAHGEARVIFFIKKESEEGGPAWSEAAEG
ncbi:endonuclease/exonuclease/phosphatase family protein, partial [Trifolium medium]|nr:endonuclease/exonuclease/phosphatase family protein [Trifolium medium]